MGGPHPIEVVVAADRNYARPLAVTVHSIARSLSYGETCRIHVLAEGFDERLRSAVAMGLDRSAVELAWTEIDSRTLGPAEDNPLWSSYLSRTTLARLLIPSALSADIARVVYVDVDTVVRHSLAPLSSLELGSKLAAAVRDPGIGWIGGPDTRLPWYDYDLDPGQPYFNGGVIVIDVATWREKQIAERAITILAELPLRHLDQDALNMVLAGQWMRLHTKWNVTPFHRRDAQSGLAWVLAESGEFEDALRDPSIMHFAGRDKPWNFRRGAMDKFQQEWFDVLDTTSFAGWRPERPTAPARIGRRVRLAVRALRAS